MDPLSAQIVDGSINPRSHKMLVARALFYLKVTISVLLTRERENFGIYDNPPPGGERGEREKQREREARREREKEREGERHRERKKERRREDEREIEAKRKRENEREMWGVSENVTEREREREKGERERRRNERGTEREGGGGLVGTVVRSVHVVTGWRSSSLSGMPTQHKLIRSRAGKCVQTECSHASPLLCQTSNVR